MIFDLDTNKPVFTTGELWTPICSLTAFKVLSAIAMVNDNEIHSLDLPAAYTQVHWPQSRPHYIRISKEVAQWFPDKSYKGDTMGKPLWKFIRCLYGHSWSGFIFCRKLVDTIEQAGFTPCAFNSGLYYKGTLCVCIYVDDVAFTGSDEEVIKFKELLSQEFEIGDVTKCTKYLGCERDSVKFTEHGKQITLVRFSMREYTKGIIQTYENLWKTKATQRKFPGTTGPKTKNTVHDEEFTKYNQKQPIKNRQIIIGQLLWLMRNTRPDLMTMVSTLSSRIHTWDDSCETALLNTIGYLKRTQHQCLYWRWVHEDEYSLENAQTCVHWDSNLATRSQGCHVLFIQNQFSRCVIHWSSRKQTLTSTSSACAELYEGSNAVQGCLALSTWLHQYIFKHTKPVMFCGDNKAALRAMCKGDSVVIRGQEDPTECTSRLQKLLIGKTKVSSSRLRTINLRLGLVSDMVAKNVLCLYYVNTKINIADGGTKLLQYVDFKSWCIQLGILSNSTEIPIYTGENLEYIHSSRHDLKMDTKNM